MLTSEEVDRRRIDRGEPTRNETARARWTATVPTRVAVVVAVAAVVVNVVVYALLPPADNPEVAQGWAYALIDLAFWVTALAAVAGLASRQRFGVGAAFAHSVVLAGAVVACPVSGHHAYGPWWLGQVAASAALLVVTGSALRATR